MHAGDMTIVFGTLYRDASNVGWPPWMGALATTPSPPFKDWLDQYTLVVSTATHVTLPWSFASTKG